MPGRLPSAVPSRDRPAPRAVRAAMWSGFLLTVLFYLLPDAEGDVLERIAPFLVALGVAALAPDRRPT